MTIGELTALLTERAKRPIPRDGREVLLCARDVLDAISENVPPAPKPGPLDFAMFGTLGNPTALIGVDIVTSDDCPPGYFKLTCHDNCDAQVSDTPGDLGTVSHESCTVIAEGTIRLPSAA